MAETEREFQVDVTVKVRAETEAEAERLVADIIWAERDLDAVYSPSARTVSGVGSDG